MLSDVIVLQQGTEPPWSYLFANEVDEQKPSISASSVVIDIQYSGSRARKREREREREKEKGRE